MPQDKKLFSDVPLDPLTEDQSRSLLDPVDVVTDPLHGDIRLTAFERVLIDTPEFQRLRGINQLAMTCIVFPGAVHNRFLHSLGTLHVCSQIITTCNLNAEVFRRLAGPDDPVPLVINSYAALLARLCALLHDLAHVPFGHTLEKEGLVFERDEWQDEDRREKLLLGNDTSLAGVFRTVFREAGLDEASADQLRAEIKTILTTKRSDVIGLRYPFVHDMVGNTICADLIDYVQRDMYFCGLKERFGKRFLEYLAVMPMKNEGEGLRPVRRENASTFSLTGTGSSSESCRLVLLQYRYNERKVPVRKHDVIAEAIDLVRRRLAVAEKLYFHRTKISASAMLIRAAHRAQLTPRIIWDMSDIEVLKYLEGSDDRCASILSTKLRQRHLFKPIYQATYHEKDDSHASELLWSEERGAYSRFKLPTEREALASRIERIIGMHQYGDSEKALGTVCVSCPEANMNLKAFDMLVVPRPTSLVRRLQDSSYPPTRIEIDAIHRMHLHLWRIEVMVDPSVVSLRPENPFTIALAGAIQKEIGPKNEIEGFGDAPALGLDGWLAELLLKHDLEILGVEDKITHEHFEELKQTAFREQGKERSLDSVREFLRSKGYTV